MSLKHELKGLIFRTAIEDDQGDSGQLLKVLKRFLKNSNSVDRILSINGKDSLEEIVAEINNFFAKIGKELAEKIPPSNLALNFQHNPEIPKLELLLVRSGLPMELCEPRR